MKADSNSCSAARVLKLSETRVWRTYTGGAGLDRWRSRTPETDGPFPEDWIASVVRAKNPGRENIIEGYSRVLNLPDQPYLKDVLEQEPEAYYGLPHLQAVGNTMGMLIKLIDAHERLTIQTHPDKEFAKKFFHSDYGKTESWYILETRRVNDEVPCIYFGFKPGVTRERWKAVFDAQDIPAMLDCLHKIPVHPGDSFIIPGGLPHAIGAGCLLAEVQEPTDYTMRTELVTPGGLHIHENQCHQGLGYERMLDCFHYDSFTEEETCRRWKVSPVVMEKHDGVCVESYIDSRYTDLFQVRRVQLTSAWNAPTQPQLQVWVVLRGSGTLKTPGEEMEIQQGDFLLLPAGLSDVVVTPAEDSRLELLSCHPPRSKQ